MIMISCPLYTFSVFKREENCLRTCFTILILFYSLFVLVQTTVLYIYIDYLEEISLRSWRDKRVECCMRQNKRMRALNAV